MCFSDHRITRLRRSPDDVRLAVWQAGWRGLHWIDELVKARKAINLGGDGYPCRYTLTAEHVIAQIAQSPPEARTTWAYDATDIITEKWEGKTAIDHGALDRCRPNEWLLIEAWDES
jgi:hypothetical protein